MKRLLVVGLVAVPLFGTVATLYVSNAPPAMPALSVAETAGSTKPYVVKLHA